MYSQSKALIAATLCGLLSGCATTPGQQQQAWGAGLGALTGGGLAALAGGNRQAITAGALAGGLIGWGAVKLSQYQATQTMTATQMEANGLARSGTSTTVNIQNGTATPGMVGPGNQVKVVTDYLVNAPAGISSVPIAETWSLKKDGQPLATLPAANQVRVPGGYAAEAYIPIPQTAEPGTYVVEHKVQAGTSYDVDESVFVVSR